ncbi:hypothetical protein BpHYR1_010511 [Brachionus plicatilis]|uniref:Uncharacterized protein n=1 Tax=Brachionus plicatilis TaxID=10195 RepID=A0A3M7T9Y4_BRAPC|nr:hypothetical protein BpHYR1_010511 [Brachionus plicatilis]
MNSRSQATKRKIFTLSQKVKFIKLIDSKEKTQTQICDEYKIPPGTMSGINKRPGFKNNDFIDVDIHKSQNVESEKVEIENLWKHFQKYRFIPKNVTFLDYNEVDKQLALYQGKTDDEVIEYVKAQKAGPEINVCDSSDDDNEETEIDSNENKEDEQNLTTQQALKMLNQIRKHLTKSVHNFELSIDNLDSLESQMLSLMVKQKTIKDYFKN